MLIQCQSLVCFSYILYVFFFFFRLLAGSHKKLGLDFQEMFFNFRCKILGNIQILMWILDYFFFNKLVKNEDKMLVDITKCSYKEKKIK